MTTPTLTPAGAGQAAAAARKRKAKDAPAFVCLNADRLALLTDAALLAYGHAFAERNREEGRKKHATGGYSLKPGTENVVISPNGEYVVCLATAGELFAQGGDDTGTLPRYLYGCTCPAFEQYVRPFAVEVLRRGLSCSLLRPVMPSEGVTCCHGLLLWDLACDRAEQENLETLKQAAAAPARFSDRSEFLREREAEFS